MAKILPFQARLRPALPMVMGNVDYRTLESQLKRIDAILKASGAEKDFMERSLNHWSVNIMKKPLEEIGDKPRLVFQQHTRRALRCNIVRILMGDSFRDFSCQLAGWPLLQWFCDVDRLGGIRVPTKSTLQRYAHWLPEEEMRAVIAGLLKGAANPATALELETPLDVASYFADTTCVKAAIHFPVDWVLFRDAVRTLMKAVLLIRKQGLKHRMDAPETFMRQMNRYAIEMTHTRRKRDRKKECKRILRLMKKLVGVVANHADRYRKLLDSQWEKTGWTRPRVEQVLKRMDGILTLLPQAMKQAHERIIGERSVKSGDKLLSFYETQTNVIVRGKAGAEVEFGNTLLLGETKQGIIADWKMWCGAAPADSRMLKESLERVRKLFGVPIKEVGGDRGFDSQANTTLLGGFKIYNGLCPRDPKILKEKMKEARFAWLQKRRSQTEGRIGIFKNQFLGKPLRVKGFLHRECAVSWAVFTHNLWVIARMPQAEAKQKAA